MSLTETIFREWRAFALGWITAAERADRIALARHLSAAVEPGVHPDIGGWISGPMLPADHLPEGTTE